MYLQYYDYIVHSVCADTCMHVAVQYIHVTIMILHVVSMKQLHFDPRLATQLESFVIW